MKDAAKFIGKHVSEIIRLGNVITYRPSFGQGDPVTEPVVRMTLTNIPRSKHGVDVLKVLKDDVRANRVVFSLEGGHWCYSEQVVLCNSLGVA